MRRRGWLVFAAGAVLAVAALLASGLSTTTVRRYALGAPDTSSVAELHRGRRVCEGPVTTPAGVDRIAVFGAAVSATAAVRVDVERVHPRRLQSSGRFTARSGGGDYVTILNRPVPRGQVVRICLTGERNTFSLLGSAAVNPAITMSGAHRGLEFSLLLDGRQSLISSLPTVFSRAALFKLSWVGSWTFWVLTAALLACFGLGGLALAGAAAADEQPPRQD